MEKLQWLDAHMNSGDEIMISKDKLINQSISTVSFPTTQIVHIVVVLFHKSSLRMFQALPIGLRIQPALSNIQNSVFCIEDTGAIHSSRH